ncbi:translation initiation factor IF-2 [Anas acuta]|uniref:translation initiation factor IF-2 n=1 Tax=Anas acuta TaxID=28680 RepID=UPI0035C88CE2
MNTSRAPATQRRVCGIPNCLNSSKSESSRGRALKRRDAKLEVPPADSNRVRFLSTFLAAPARKYLLSPSASRSPAGYPLAEAASSGRAGLGAARPWGSGCGWRGPAGQGRRRRGAPERGERHPRAAASGTPRLGAGERPQSAPCQSLGRTRRRARHGPPLLLPAAGSEFPSSQENPSGKAGGFRAPRPGTEPPPRAREGEERRGLGWAGRPQHLRGPRPTPRRLPSRSREERAEFRKSGRDRSFHRGGGRSGQGPSTGQPPPPGAALGRGLRCPPVAFPARASRCHPRSFAPPPPALRPGDSPVPLGAPGAAHGVSSAGPPRSSAAANLARVFGAARG